MAMLIACKHFAKLDAVEEAKWILASCRGGQRVVGEFLISKFGWIHHLTLSMRAKFIYRMGWNNFIVITGRKIFVPD